MRFREICREGEKRLAAAGIPDAAVDAWYLMEFVTHKSRAQFLLCREDEMPEPEREEYMALIERRASHIPLQQITGEQEFMGFSFMVNDSVLIPRQDTEILVEEACRRIRPGMRVLDLCTGSGCITHQPGKALSRYPGGSLRFFPERRCRWPGRTERAWAFRSNGIKEIFFQRYRIVMM